MNQRRPGLGKRLLQGHMGHVLVAISWCFILFVMLRPSLNRPWFVECIPSEQESFSYYAEVTHAYPIWTVIIGSAHVPSSLLTWGVTSLLQKFLSVSCAQTAKIELVVFFLFSSIQWLLIGFGIESLLVWMKSRKNHRRSQQALGADSSIESMNTSCPSSQSIRRFLSPKAILFGVCVLNFLVSLMFVRRVELEAQVAIAAGHWGYSEHWNPVAEMWEPFLLLVAVVALLVSRWWSLLLALLDSGRILYVLGYLSWRAIHYAQDVPMFSWSAVEGLWYVIYSPRPQYLIEILIAGGIFVYAVLRLGKLSYLRFRGQIVGG